MLRKVNDLTGNVFKAIDGTIGKCKDFIYDDHSWAIRYLVADTGHWLPGRKVVISPTAVILGDWESDVIPLRITKDMLESAPTLDEHAPVSREYEIEYYKHFTYSSYWLGPDLWGAYPDPYGAIHPIDDVKVKNELQTQKSSNHLRSATEVTKYNILANDGSLGHIEDFLFDDCHWQIRYIAINTRNWLPGKSFLIPIQWCGDIVWEAEQAEIKLNRETIKSSPVYDPSLPIGEDFENELENYYNKANS